MPTGSDRNVTQGLILCEMFFRVCVDGDESRDRQMRGRTPTTQVGPLQSHYALPLKQEVSSDLRGGPVAPFRDKKQMDSEETPGEMVLQIRSERLGDHVLDR